MGRRPSRVELAPGDPAPDFLLLASDGRWYRLSDFRDCKAVVIAWFPKAFTGGCTKECRSLAAERERLGQFEVALFGASVDGVEANRSSRPFWSLDTRVVADRASVRCHKLASGPGWSAS